MPSKYKPLSITDRIELSYLIGEEEHKLEIKARRIAPTEPVRSTILNTAYATAAARYGTCGWFDDVYARLGVSMGSGNRSYFSYLNNIYADAEIRAALVSFNELIDELDDNLSVTDINVLTVSSDDSSQFYNRTGTGQKTDGQILTFGSGGSCRLCFYLDTVYTPDPTTQTFVYGLSRIQPGEESSTYILPATGFAVNQYSTADPPLISFWSVPVEMDDADNDGSHYGETVQCLFVLLRLPGNPIYLQHTIISLNAFESREIEDDPTTDDPGQTVTPSGWVGPWDFSSDSDGVQPVSGFDFVNRWAHGIRLYYISDDDASAFMTALWNMSLSQAVDLAIESALFRQNVDFIRGVVCLHKLPVTVSTSGTSALTIMGFDLSKKFAGLSSFSMVSDNYGSVKQIVSDPLPVPYTYGDTVFMDWDSCRAMLQLPFIGTVPIDIKAVRGGSLYVSYNIDILTGNCQCQVYGTSSVQSKPTVLLYQGSGNCALPIPFAGNSEGAFKQLGAVAGIAGGIAAAVGTGSMSPLMHSLGSMVHPHNTGSYQYQHTEAASMSNLSCRLIITGSVPLVAPMQRQIEGYRAGATSKVGAFSGTGYLQGTVHAEIQGATAAEQQQIEAMIKGGIVL